MQLIDQPAVGDDDGRSSHNISLDNIDTINRIVVVQFFNVGLIITNKTC
jgi:hypothetical protein